VFHENYAGSRHATLDIERSSFIQRHSTAFNAGKIIDVGCGQGSLLRKLNLPKLEKFGLDPIQDTVNNLTDEVTFINGFIETYDVSNIDEFEVVSCISSLEHYYSPEAVLEKFNNMLILDGMLVLEIPDSLVPESQLAEFFSFEHLTHFTEASLIRMLNLYGFEVVEFDRNVSIPNIRVAAKKVENNKYKVAHESEISLLKGVIKTYVSGKEKIINRMASFLDPVIADCRLLNRSVMVYGAGDHSVHLFTHFGLETYVCNYIDGDPKKWGTTFRGKLVLAPSAIESIVDSTIVISSHNYEDEILKTISKHNVNSLAVISLYNK
jgi:SAM-dependent methyltransferase